MFHSLFAAELTPEFRPSPLHSYALGPECDCSVLMCLKNHSESKDTPEFHTNRINTADEAARTEEARK